MGGVTMVLGYSLIMWGGVVLMIPYGLTGMVSRYTKFAGADRRFTAFDINFACVVLGVFMVLQLTVANYA